MHLANNISFMNRMESFVQSDKAFKPLYSGCLLIFFYPSGFDCKRILSDILEEVNTLLIPLKEGSEYYTNPLQAYLSLIDQLTFIPARVYLAGYGKGGEIAAWLGVRVNSPSLPSVGSIIPIDAELSGIFDGFVHPKSRIALNNAQVNNLNNSILTKNTNGSITLDSKASINNKNALAVSSESSKAIFIKNEKIGEESNIRMLLQNTAQNTQQSPRLNNEVSSNKCEEAPYLYIGGDIIPLSAGQQKASLEASLFPRKDDSLKYGTNDLGSDSNLNAIESEIISKGDVLRLISHQKGDDSELTSKPKLILVKSEKTGKDDTLKLISHAFPDEKSSPLSRVDSKFQLSANINNETPSLSGSETYKQSTKNSIPATIIIGNRVHHITLNPNSPLFYSIISNSTSNYDMYNTNTSPTTQIANTEQLLHRYDNTSSFDAFLRASVEKHPSYIYQNLQSKISSPTQIHPNQVPRIAILTTKLSNQALNLDNIKLLGDMDHFGFKRLGYISYIEIDRVGSQILKVLLEEELKHNSLKNKL